MQVSNIGARKAFHFHLVADLRQLNRHWFKYPLAMDSLQSCQISYYYLYQFHWYRLVIGWIHLCRMFSLNYLYIANIFHWFFFEIQSSVLQLIYSHYRHTLSIIIDIQSLSNVKISPLFTNFVIFNSAVLAWLSFPLFETFYILLMVIWFSIIWLRNFSFSSSSNETFTVNSVILFLSWRLDIKCSILFLFV